MSREVSVLRIARCSIGLLILPILLSAQEKKPCWLRDATSPAPATAYLLCEQGGLWTTRDSGVTWNSLSTGINERHRAFAWIDSRRGIVVGNGGLILTTEDGGRTWKRRESEFKENLMDVAFVGEQGWIAGYQGKILHSTDGGQTWSIQRTNTTMTLESIFFLDKDHGWTVGWSGTILRTSDGGKTWTSSKSSSASWTLNSVYFHDLNNGWIVGFSGQLLHSTDGGATWTAQTSPVRATLNAIAFDGAGRAWITYDEGLLLSEDQGKTWKEVNPGGRYFLGKLLTMDKSLMAIGQSVLLQQTAGGKEWKKVPSFAADRILSEAEAAAAKDEKQQ